IGQLAIVVAVVMGILVAIFEKSHQTERGIITAVAFLIGASLSGISGYIGMYVAVRSNIRTAAAARKGMGEAMVVALRGGAVSGFLVVALGLLGISGVYWLVSLFAEGDNPAIAETPFWIVGFAFGASFVALFAQLGGGIYTKAADVGADLVGKVEAGIPEDDPRNPAVIADLVGDNVGDCAGRGADLFESTAAENVGAMILGIALYPVFGMGGIVFPLLARAFGLIATIVGVFTVRCREDEDPMNALNRGYLVTTVIAMGGFAAAVFLLLRPAPDLGVEVHRGYLLFAGIIGILTAYAFVWITQYYTEYRYR